MRKTKKKIIICAIAICLILSIVIGTIITLTTKSDYSQVENEQFISLAGKFTETKVTNEESAIKAAQDAATLLGLGDVADELTLKNKNTVDGITYYRLQQMYKGYPIYGRTAVVIANYDGTTQGFSSNMTNISNVDFTSSLNEDKIINNVTNYLKKHYSYNDISNVVIKSPAEEELQIYKLFEQEHPILIYESDVKFTCNGQEKTITLVIDISNSDVIATAQTIYSDNAICYNENKSIDFLGLKLSDEQYLMKDVERNIYIYNGRKQEVFDINTVAQVDVAKAVVSSDNIFGNENESKDFLNYDVAATFLNNLNKIYDFYDQKYNQTGIDILLGIYNDNYDQGNNGLGGAISISKIISTELPEYESSKTSGIAGLVSIGSNKLKSLDTIAHEYTHVITRCNVNWIDRSTQKYDYTGAINEGYSDIFGEIIEGYILNRAPDWVHFDRIMYNPSINNYPETIDDGRKFEKLKDGSYWCQVQDFTGKKYYSDYSHAYSTVISHAAYLMTSNKIAGTALSIDELSDLWYNTMLTLPSDCTFSTLRKNMEMTAKIIGFSKEKINRISAAFDEVGINNEDSDNILQCSTELEVQVLASFDGNIKPTSQYKIIIEGKEDGFLWFTEDYYNEIDVANNEWVTLTLKEGEYIVSVTDGNSTYSQKIKTKKDCDNQILRFVTDFAYIKEFKKPTEADFEAFTKMFEKSIVVWYNSDNFTSANLTTSEIIDDYITYNMFSYYLTLFDGDTITSEEVDPLNILYSCKKFKGENIDWILEKIFNKTPDHSSLTGYHYYYDGNWYIEGAQNITDNGIIVKSISQEYRQIKENKYQITIRYDFDNRYTNQAEKWEYVFVTNLNYDQYLGNYWSIESFSKKSLLPGTTTDSDNNDTNDNPPVSLNKICLADLKPILSEYYEGNEGDSRIFILEGEEYRNGNIGINGERYQNGLEIWIARWNYTEEISWVKNTYNLSGKGAILSGKTGVIASSYNSNNFNTTVYFYGDGTLLDSITLTDTNFQHEFEIDVSNVQRLEILVQDNIAVCGGTSFALYDLFVTGDFSDNSNTDVKIIDAINYTKPVIATPDSSDIGWEPDGMVHTIKIPKLTLETSNAKEFNQKLYDVFGEEYKLLLNNQENNQLFSCNYEYRIYHGVVGIVIEKEYGVQCGGISVFYEAFYYDTNQDKELTFEEYLSALETDYKSISSNMQNTSEYKDYYGYISDYNDVFINDCIVDSNSSIVYLNDIETMGGWNRIDVKANLLH